MCCGSRSALCFNSLELFFCRPEELSDTIPPAQLDFSLNIHTLAAQVSLRVPDCDVAMPVANFVISIVQRNSVVVLLMFTCLHHLVQDAQSVSPEIAAGVQKLLLLFA